VLKYKRNARVCAESARRTCFDIDVLEEGALGRHALGAFGVLLPALRVPDANGCGLLTLAGVAAGLRAWELLALGGAKRRWEPAAAEAAQPNWADLLLEEVLIDCRVREQFGNLVHGARYTLARRRWTRWQSPRTNDGSRRAVRDGRPTRGLEFSGGFSRAKA
jgi:hypothetical protein